MSRRIIGALAGALVATSLAAPVAQAGAPARVSVRVEAPGRTLADATLTTRRAPVAPDGTDACSGTSAGGALWQATQGSWSGSWFDSFGDYAVDAIAGVRAPADFSAYWAFWLNGRMATKGVCGTELQNGDDVLEFLCTSTPDFSSCTNLPLELRVLRPYRGSMEVAVVRLDGNGGSAPLAGATVRGGTHPVATAGDGTVRVTLREGQSTLRATHAGNVPSARLHCHHGAHGAGCGSRDRTPPTLKLVGLADGRTFAAAQAPRTLHGVARDPEGATVALRLTRRAGGRCSRFDAGRGAFRPCAKAPRAPFAAGDRARWSFLLPARLAPGRYRLDAIATDGAGNRRVLHVRFRVSAMA
jgi:Domain of unknown function (DUF4430)